MRKLAVSAFHVKAVDFIKGLFLCLARKNPVGDFESILADFLHTRHCFTVSSQGTAFYIILKSLYGISGRKEVIIPAYTHDGLTGVIKKLGLKAIYCDILPDSFSLNKRSLTRLVSKNTLCVVAVHAFGIPCDLKPLQDITREENVYLVEDFSRAVGSYYHDRKVGAIGDAGFTGFDREGNLSLYSGGCIVTNNDELAEVFGSETSRLGCQNSISGFRSFAKMVFLSIFLKPFVYGLLPVKVVNSAKEKGGLKADLKRFSGIQAAIGLSVMKNILDSNIKRLFNGTFLMERLKAGGKVKVLKMPVYSRAIFNQVPVIFDSIDEVKEVKRRLKACGIESSPGGLKLLKPLPNSKRHAGNILALPVHEYVQEKDINRMVDIILNYVK